MDLLLVALDALTWNVENLAHWARWCNNRSSGQLSYEAAYAVYAAHPDLRPVHHPSGGVPGAYLIEGNAKQRFCLTPVRNLYLMKTNVKRGFCLTPIAQRMGSYYYYGQTAPNAVICQVPRPPTAIYQVPLLSQSGVAKHLYP